MESASAVECVPMEITAARNVPATAITAANVATANVAPANVAPADVATARVSMHPTAAIRPIRMPVPWTTSPSIGPAPASQPTRTMEPRPSANEQTTYKPVRTVIPVGRAGIGIVAVIAVRANWRSGDIPRTDSYAHSNRTNPNSDADPDLRL